MQTIIMDQMFECLDPLLEEIVSMPADLAVVDMPQKRLDEAHRHIVKGLNHAFVLQSVEIARRYCRFFELWKELQKSMEEAWNIARIKREANLCRLTLISLQEQYKMIRARLQKEESIKFWSGDAIRMRTKMAIDRLPFQRSQAVRSLFETLKRCLSLEDSTWCMRYIEIFFQVLAHYEFALAVKLLDAFSFEQTHLRDVALLCLLASSKQHGTDGCIDLLKRFTTETNRLQGVQLLFSSCYESDPLLAEKLIKKMPERSMRNRALADLSTSRAQLGDWEKAKEYCEQISSQLLLQQQRKTIESMMEDTRPVFTGFNDC